MRDRSEQILRLTCLVLAGLVLAEICHAILRVNPLRGVMVPAVPTLVTNTVAITNSMTNGTPNIGSAQTNTAGTNLITSSNSVALTNHASLSTNGTPSVGSTQTNGSSQHVVTESGASTNALTNGAPNSSSARTNVTTKLAGPETSAPTNLVSTNIVVNTNSLAGTNSVTTNSVATNNVPTNAPAVSGKHRQSRMMGGMMGMSGGGAALSPLIQARVDQIVSSEMFAPVMHPQPMALMGIAGDTIFLRTDSGQSGLVKIGDSLGNVKLLRIGINRALVEQDGQKKELMIFDGFGSDSLLSTKDESSK